MSWAPAVIGAESRPLRPQGEGESPQLLLTLLLVRSLQLPTPWPPRPRLWSLDAPLAGWAEHLGGPPGGDAWAHVPQGVEEPPFWARTSVFSVHWEVGKAGVECSALWISDGMVLSSFVHIFICMACCEACVVPALLKFKTVGFIHVRVVFSVEIRYPPPAPHFSLFLSSLF